jgi:hypothetical protein
MDGNTDVKTGQFLQILSGLSAEERIIMSSGKYSKGVSYGKYKVPTRIIVELLKFYNQSRKRAPLNRLPADKNSGIGQAVN